VVNLHALALCNKTSVKVWKVQKEPGVKMKVGQSVWFMSGIIEKEVMVNAEGKYVVRPQQYEGRIEGVVEWQRNWVRFLVTSMGSGDFHLWVPLEWAALGLVHRVQHLWQRQKLADDIPPLPKVTETSMQTRRLETSRAIRVRKVLEVVPADNGVAIME
jgi:hypothetical protein